MDFNVTLMPLDTFLAFAIGFGLSRLLPPIQRLALPEAKRRATVEQATKASFVDLGVSKTTARTGVLVHVSLFEGIVAIVADAGVTPEAKKAIDEARATPEASLAQLDIGAFATTIEGLGAKFSETTARSADDVNELTDAAA